MGLARKILNNAHQHYREYGLRGTVVTAKQTANWIRHQTLDQTVYRFARRGSQNIYERDWDVLILLDCARVDLMSAVADEYEFIHDIEEYVSPGTTSPEWMAHTFTEEYLDEMANTLHVTANTSSDRYLNEDEFLHLEEVWRDGWDPDYKTILPRTVTDRAIALHRELKPNRTIIHYMQPHAPFIPYQEVNAGHVTGPGVGEDRGKSVGELYREEDYSRDELWEFYRGNLRYVLDDLAVLLSNIDGSCVVISADHGEALGEGGEWGHRWGSTVDSLRRVPWCVTSASDSGEYTPVYQMNESDSDRGNQVSVEQKLAYLGYTSESS